MLGRGEQPVGQAPEVTRRLALPRAVLALEREGGKRAGDHGRIVGRQRRRAHVVGEEREGLEVRLADDVAHGVLPARFGLITLR
jgi:hypothetical protein